MKKKKCKYCKTEIDPKAKYVLIVKWFKRII